MQAQEIVDMITQSERYANSTLFSDEQYRDEPILRTGASAYPHLRQEREQQGRKRSPMPARYRQMRALARKQTGWGYSYGSGGARLFYEQGKLMEDFEDDFEILSTSHLYRPCYNEMSDVELRSYFSWRTQYRAGNIVYAPIPYLYVQAYEYLCGIGVEPGQDGYDALWTLADDYAGVSQAFDSQMNSWLYDYMVYHGLDASLLIDIDHDDPYRSVVVLRRAQEVLLSGSTPGTWPDGPQEGLPEKTEVLDALCALSRYRAEKSRFFKGHRDEAADVVAHVFARMVDHCHKRRKTDYVDGLFGSPTTYAYTMFSSALFWSEEPHEDTVYQVDEAERFYCTDGFWYHEYPCRRLSTSKELGSLLHAIDCRMRLALNDPYPLKERSIAKYQGNYVDQEIAAMLERQAAAEKTKLHIDRSSLGGIRSAAARTREALLTDEEREDETPNAVTPSPAPVAVPASTLDLTQVPESAPASNGLALDAGQEALLRSLLDGGPAPVDVAGGFVSLAVDAINEVFLDIVGDNVIEFDGDDPVLVEDYVQDVRDVLG